MKNLLPIRLARRVAGLLLSAWLLAGVAWAGTGLPRTGRVLPVKKGTSLTSVGLVPSPASANSCVGSGVSTYVNVTGTGPFTYQWYRNQPTTAEPVSGKTFSSLSLYPLQLSDAGSYYCQVTKPDSSVLWSDAFVLTVNAAMTASTPVLGASTICQGGSTTVSATFGGSATQGYFSYNLIGSPFGYGGSFTNYVTSGNTVTATFTSSSSSSTVDTLAITFIAFEPSIQCSALSAVARLVVKPSVQANYFSLDNSAICQGGSTRVEFTFYSSNNNNGGGTFGDGGKGGTFSDISDYYSDVSATYTPAPNFTGQVSFTYLTPVPNGAGVCVSGSSSYYNPLAVSAPSTASAITLGDTLICQNKGTTVSATFGGGGTFGRFDDGGAQGNFTNQETNGKTVSAVYTPDPFASGTVTITFTTDDDPLNTGPSGPCPPATSTARLTVRETATAGSVYISGQISGGPRICQGSNAMVSATFGGGASSGSFSDGTAGGTFSAISTSNKTVSATYTPPVGFTGSVTITFTTNDPDGSAGCAAATSTNTLTVNQPATITTPTLGATTICQGGSTTVSVTFGGGVSGGYFYDNAGGSFTNQTTTNKTLSATYTPRSDFAGEVTITAQSYYPDYPCEPVDSKVKLTVNATATASTPVLGAATICQGSSTTVSATFGGSATGGSFNDGTAGGTFSNISTSGSTVTATYTPPAGFTGTGFLFFTTTGPCAAASSNVGLTVNQAATITGLALGSSVVCKGIAFVTVSAKFSSGYREGFNDGGAGGRFDNYIYFPNSNATQASYFPKSDFVGTITFTATSTDPDGSGPCPAVTSTIDLLVKDAPTASTPTLGTTTICQGSSTSVSATFGGTASSGTFTDGTAGGTFTNISTTNKTVSATYTPAATYSGTTTITFTTNDPDGSGGCAAATSTVSLTVNPAATATTPTLGAATICQNSNTSVSASFGGSASSGSFSDGSVGGSFSVTTTSGVVSGTYSPPASYSGPVTITFTTNDPDGSGPCVAATSTVSLTVNPLATATTPTLGASTICQGNNVNVSASFGGGASSGSFSDGAVGGTFNVTTTNGVVSGTYSPPATYAGPVTITFSTNDPDGSGPCVAATSTAPSLTVNPAATASTPTLGASGICQGNSTSVSATFGGSASSASFSDGAVGGTFSVTTASGVVSGTYTPPASYFGPVTITFTTNDPDGSGPCAATTSTVGLTVNALPIVSLSALAASYCQNIPASTPGTPAGGSYVIDGGSPVASFNPASLTAGMHSVVYTFVTTAGCNASATKSVEIIPLLYTQQPTMTGAPLCAGRTISLSFNANECLKAGNSFTAYLSDAAGSFAAPVSLGSVTPGGNNTLTIPAGTLTGSGYRIHIASVNAPSLTSNVTDAFSVTGLAANFNSTATVSQVPACAGATIKVSFTQQNAPACSFPLGNAFSAELSDASGSFASPLNLGSVSPGLNNVTVPPGTPPGSGYRVRIAATTAGSAAYSMASAAFSVNGPSFSSTPTVSGDNKCAGEAVRLSFGTGCAFPVGNSFTAELSNATGSFASPVNVGTVTPGGLNNVVIPPNIVAGTGYKLRIVSSNPAAMSAVSGSFKVKACGNSREIAQEPALVVLPNPVRGGEIRCRVSGPENPQFSLTTITGRNLGLSVKTDGSGEWVLTPQHALTVGVYVLQASQGQTRLTTRVLVIE